MNNFTATFTEDDDLWYAEALGARASGSSPMDALGILFVEDSRLRQVRGFVDSILPDDLTCKTWHARDKDEVCACVHRGGENRSVILHVGGLRLVTGDLWKEDLRQQAAAIFKKEQTT